MISIIVPVYNVEQYLERCINSVLSQTYKDFELLLIDDGSKDESGSICDRYKEKDNRIRVFHKENGGLSDARNYGLERMQGDYVCFIDSDDYIGRNYLKTMIDMIVENDADMSVINFAKIYDDEPAPAETEDKRYVMDGKSAFYEMITMGLFCWGAWAKLMKKEIAHELWFPKGYVYEDLHTIPYLMAKCKCCVYSEAVEYYYIQRRNSIMHVITPKQIGMWEEGIEKLAAYTKENYPEYSAEADALIVNGIFDNFIDFLLDNKSYMTVVRHMKRKYIVELKNSLFSDTLGFKRKINVLLFLINPNLYRLVKKKWLKMKPDNDDRRNRLLVES